MKIRFTLALILSTSLVSSCVKTKQYTHTSRFPERVVVDFRNGYDLGSPRGDQAALGSSLVTFGIGLVIDAAKALIKMEAEKYEDNYHGSKWL